MDKTNPTPPVNHHLQHQFEELRQRALHDALTGLLNRATLEQCIKQRLEEMGPEDTCALFIVDLDDFKQVNDTLGHQAGDQALRQSAQILSGLFRASDIVGRLGGDEFVIFLSGRVTEKLARRKGTEICKALQLALGDRQVIHLTASVGIYLSDGRQRFEGMYQAADLALYKAKKAGKRGFCLKSCEGYQDQDEDFHPVSAIPLSGLLENMDGGVALLEMGEKPRLIYTSPSFCRIIGADPQAYSLPRPLAALIHPDDLAALERALWDGLQENRAVEHTHRVRAGDGRRWLWWHIRAVQIHYDNPNPVLLVTTTDISQFKESQQQLEEVNRRLQTAFDQTAQRLWEVDVATRTFTSYGRDGKSRVLEYDGVEFPDHLIDGGWIHPSSVARFRQFARELLGGQSRGYGNFILRHRQSTGYGWVALSYRMLYDEVGRAARAVGIVEDLPRNLLGTATAMAPRRPLPEGLLADLTMHMRANLTRDTVDDVWMEGRQANGQGSHLSCTALLHSMQEGIFAEDSQLVPPACFDPAQLLHRFRQGQQWLSAEYRRTDSSGNIRWVRHTLHLVEDPLTHDVSLHLYLIRIDAARQWEQAAECKVSRDDAGLYSRESIERIAQAVFCGQGPPDNRAMALFQTDGLAGLTGESGRQAKRIRRTVAAALSVALGGGCLLGQYEPDQILILLPTAANKEELRRRLEEAIAFIRQSLTAAPAPIPLRFIAGVALAPAGETDYRALLNKAACTCGLWWNAAADTVAFASEEEDWGWSQLQSGEPGDQIAICTSEMERPLSAEEKEVAFHCMSAMLAADSLEISMRSVLHAIGAYYRADRVYLLMLAEKGHVVTMPFEWTSPSKNGIQQAVSGMRLARFPLLERCMAERAPLFLTRAQPLSPSSGADAGQPWYFTALPLMEQEQVNGFLCIENAREHPADAALLGTLIPCLLREWNRFRGGRQAAGTVEQLMDLPDLRSYMGTVYTLTSDRYSSLGAVCLDIPGMAAINGSLGFEYGSKLLWYVSKTLTDLFGTQLLFPTWEAEFIAFCPNTTRQVFLGRCVRLRSILQRRYPREVRIGRAWAEGTFTGKALAEEARRCMRLEQVKTNSDDPEHLLHPQGYATVGDAARSGRFTVYFQPKIDLRTGALTGLEALVRGVDDDGTIIPPAQFIPVLEESGGIRELDLFVLERAYAQVDRWREAGHPIIPVSVNLSRVTLLHPSTLASVLAIQSRYPLLPAQTLELEITESAGAIKTADFQQLVDQFHACGLRLTLDDFGSQYANLSLFANVKFDTVKLDRSLITGLPDNPINQMLIRDIVQICQAGGMTCLAEGVETQAQIAALLETGCHYAQGYYFDRPLPAEQFEQKYLPTQGDPNKTKENRS